MLGSFFLGCSGSNPERLEELQDAGTDSYAASCEGISCWSPPPPSCGPNGALELPAPGGYCTEGACQYPTRDQACSVGTCQAGQCNASACEGVTCNHPPTSQCASPDAVQMFAQQGYCADGTCSYASREQLCGADACNAGVCGASTCEGVYCDKPPARHCADATTLLIFAPGGVCTSASGDAECLHADKLIACDNGCEDGYCVEDRCLGISCTVPPASYCSGGELVVFEPNGRCDEGSCVYDSRHETCEHGCESGQCVDDPCVGVICSNMPAPYCVNGGTLRTFSAGACDEGVCVYEPQDETCTNGCNAGQCVGDLCSGVVCNAPPSNACVSNSVLRSWDGQPGTCVGGFCEYETVQQACANGCAAGQCTGDPCVGVTCSNPPADHCTDASTLLRYTSPTGTCAGGSCTYASETEACPSACEAGKCVAGGESCEPDTCNNHGTCDDTGGQVSCSCGNGWTGDRCEQNVDECTTGEHDCDPNASCADTDGSFECTCEAGYEGSGTSCADVDGCAGDPCFLGVACVDVAAPGTGFTCGACPTGYEGDGEACADIDSCDPNPCAGGVACTDVPAPGTGYSCGGCPPGMEGDGTNCTDIDGCANAPCFAGVACSDVPAPGSGFTCGACPTGYEGDGKACTDIDGCAGDPCFAGVICTDEPAPGTGFACGPCPTGYTGDGQTCTNIDDCAPNPCENGGTCTDQVAGFSCSCTFGWGGDACADCEPSNGGVEQCDGFDNDCNGQTDEGLMLSCGGADPNGCGGPCPDGANQGLCQQGTRACDSASSSPGNSVWLPTCENATGPATEVCDLQDNDCDGVTDEVYDLQYDVSNCGGCGNDCATTGSLWPDFGGLLPPHVASVGCDAGSCVATSCDPGWGDDPGNSFADCLVDNSVPTGCEGAISFTDAKLEAAIRDTVNKPTGSILYSDLVSVSSLTATNSGIFSLDGLECLTGLTHLDLYGNEVTDITPLSNLHALTVLWIGNNSISDVSPIADLTSLEDLSFSENNISDLTPLSGLTGLRRLWGENNGISNISTLATATEMVDLNLSENSITNIDSLANMQELEWLWLDNNSIQDIQAISGLAVLTRLGISRNEIVSVSALSGLTSLTNLSLSWNKIENADPLGSLSNLVSLDLDGNAVSSVAALGALQGLTSLSLYGNQVSDISPIGQLVALTELSLVNNNIVDVSHLVTLQSLASLNLSANSVVDVSALKDLLLLSYLGLADNAIEHIGSLVANDGLASGDVVALAGNSLNCTDPQVQADIATLESRGVNLTHDCP
jgi:Leucine-rich repeat (LRR) protein